MPKSTFNPFENVLAEAEKRKSAFHARTLQVQLERRAELHRLAEEADILLDGRKTKQRKQLLSV